MHVDNVCIPWVKSLSLICSDLLQRIFVCCPCLWLACLHSPCWFTCCWHISSKWHPNWCLQVAGPSVTRLSTPHAYTHAHTHAQLHTHISTTHFQPDSDGTILSTFSIWLWVTLWTSRSVLVHAEWREQCSQRHMQCASPLVSQTSVALHSFSGEFG